MDAARADTYYTALLQIEAQEIMSGMKIADYPHLKPNDRTDFHQAIHRQAYPKTYNSAPIGPVDLAKRLGLGIVRKKHV